MTTLFDFAIAMVALWAILSIIGLAAETPYCRHYAAIFVLLVFLCWIAARAIE